ILGKLDRRALPPPPAVRMNVAAPVRPAHTAGQQLLVEMVVGVRVVALISIDDEFFEIDGHSKFACRIVAEVRHLTGRQYLIAVVFGMPTVSQVAAWLDRDDSAPSDQIVPLAVGGSGPPLFCIHPAGGTVFCYQELAAHLRGVRPVYGIQ